jgi:hypothetical protein
MFIYKVYNLITVLFSNRGDHSYHGCYRGYGSHRGYYPGYDRGNGRYYTCGGCVDCR